MSSVWCCQLLEYVVCYDVVIIEDDYDLESNFIFNLLLVLKVSDCSGWVVYVSSLLKVLLLGLWLGFMVVDLDLIDEVCVLCWLVYCYLLINIQYQMVYFFVQGYYEIYLWCYYYDFVQCWECLYVVLQCYLLLCCVLVGSEYVNVFWLQILVQINIQQFIWCVVYVGVLIEFGVCYFFNVVLLDNYFCMGFYVINFDVIVQGVEVLCGQLEQMGQWYCLYLMVLCMLSSVGCRLLKGIDLSVMCSVCGIVVEMQNGLVVDIEMWCFISVFVS